MAEHVVINAVHGSFSQSTLLINLKVDSGNRIYGYPLDKNNNSQGKISSSLTYATFSDDTQQTLSIKLGEIPEGIHVIKAYIEDKQRPSTLKPVCMLSYQAQGMDEIEIASGIVCLDHALTLEKKGSMWRFWFGEYEDWYKCI